MLPSLIPSSLSVLESKLFSIDLPLKIREQFCKLVTDVALHICLSLSIVISELVLKVISLAPAERTLIEIWLLI
ncbi:unnamed protein product [Moneuplotes crassus]|uniref:Uncharacterized protein n=1 Tax=Euplotes crassus TaxID=5936 RepID=A0AAD1Y604_EUPCR|nr:unnamed protein product [Moneuplotes crassus]